MTSYECINLIRGLLCSTLSHHSLSDLDCPFLQVEKPATPPKPEAKPVTLPDAPHFKSDERLEHHAFMASARKSRMSLAEMMKLVRI